MFHAKIFFSRPPTTGQMKQNVTEAHKIICFSKIATLHFMVFALVITITITVVVLGGGASVSREVGTKVSSVVT